MYGGVRSLMALLWPHKGGTWTACEGKDSWDRGIGQIRPPMPRPPRCWLPRPLEPERRSFETVHTCVLSWAQSFLPPGSLSWLLPTYLLPASVFSALDAHTLPLWLNSHLMVHQTPLPLSRTGLLPSTMLPAPHFYCTQAGML